MAATSSLTFLGTGCGIPMADRVPSSILLETGEGHRFLLDAGEPCSQRLKALGVPFDSLEAVLLSHAHSDHVAGLPMLIQGAWLEPRLRKLPVLLPGELVAPFRAWLEAVYLPDGLLPFALEWRAWENLREPAELPGGLRVTVNRTTHLESLRKIIDPKAQHRFLPYSLDLRWPEGGSGGRRLVYSADLGEPGDLDNLLRGQPTDVLICELAHFSPEELFRYLADKRIGTLLLTHPTAEVSARAKEVQRQATHALPDIGTIRMVRDDERVEIFG